MTVHDHGFRDGLAAPDGPSREFRQRLDNWLRECVERGGSDLHLKPRRAPLLRLNGKLVPLSGPEFEPADLQDHLTVLISEAQRERLKRNLRLEFGYSVSGVARFRGTIFSQRGTLVASFRRLAYELPNLDEANLPTSLRALCGLDAGLVIVAGDSESGRSTTMAALAREIVDKRLVQLMTIEDPIEYLIEDGMGSVTQQEVGTDTPGYLRGLELALRQRPDVLLVDRVDRADVFQTLSAAAQDGCLVLTSMKAPSVRGVLEQCVKLDASRDPRQVCRELAHSLKAIVAQQLVGANGAGKLPAVEILRDSTASRAAIANGEFQRLIPILESDDEDQGMQTMEQSLAALLVNETIDGDEALRCAYDAPRLEQLVRSLTPSSTSRRQPTEDVMSNADFSRIRRAIQADEELTRLQESAERAAQAATGQIAELEAEIRSLRDERDAKETALKTIEAEREEILAAVERHSQKVDQESERQQERIRQLESQIQRRARSDEDRSRRLQLLEEERQRIVSLVESHCREYELKISMLEAQLRDRGTG